MPTLDWNTFLAALGYAALTGIFNLIFARKSQIEAWAESRPRLAAVLKLTRSLGFDPWNALSALSLFFAKKLPQVQKSDSVIAQVEQQKASEKLRADAGDVPVHFGPLLVLLFLVLTLHQQGCSAAPLTAKRCDFTNPEYSAHVALCRQEIAETCLLNEDETPRADCPALIKCQEWRVKECS